jgi:hypothetical protein
MTGEEIDAARTPKGGWKMETLAVWGVAWPPPRGWKRELTEKGKTRSAPPTCPSCGGLNVGCPEGCGRDAETGVLNGTRLCDKALFCEVAEKVNMTDLDSPPWDRKADPTIPILRDEEDEPDFRPLLTEAKARLEVSSPDADLIRGLLGMIDHLYGEIEAMENHIGDYGPPCEEEDDPRHLAAVLARGEA